MSARTQHYRKPRQGLAEGFLRGVTALGEIIAPSRIGDAVVTTVSPAARDFRQIGRDGLVVIERHKRSRAKR